MGSYIEEGIPEIKKTLELDLLCKIYRAKLYLISGNAEAAKAMLKGAQKLLKTVMNEPNIFPQSMVKTIHSQYITLIRLIKAEQVNK